MIGVGTMPLPAKPLSNIQKEMLKVLSDGLPHKKIELHACLADDLGSMKNIHAHITFIRKHLREKGQDIICEFFKRKIHYRHVKLLRGITANHNEKS